MPDSGSQESGCNPAVHSAVVMVALGVAPEVVPVNLVVHHAEDAFPVLVHGYLV